jgi:hypothetical protein
MLNIFKKKDPIDEFWIWFVKNRKAFEDLPSHDDDYAHRQLRLIGRELQKVSDGLLVEVSKNADGLRDLTITAEGNTQKFPIIQQIVERALEVPGWKITAFRQPMPIGIVLNAGDLEYNPVEMFFEAFDDNGELDVLIYAKNLAKVEKEKVFHFGMVLMDNFLGEYDSAMSVRRFGFRDINDAEAENELTPMLELPKFVADFNKTKSN